MKNIYIIRHGELEDSSVYFGKNEAGLSSKGIETSQKVADIMKKEGISQVISSTQSRAVYMAAAISLNCSCPVFTDTRVSAKSYGERAGSKKEPGKNEDILTKWYKKKKGEESYYEVAKRASSLLEEIAGKDNGNVAIATHECVMKACYSLIFNDIYGIRKHFDYGHILKVENLEKKKFFKLLDDEIRTSSEAL